MGNFDHIDDKTTKVYWHGRIYDICGRVTCEMLMIRKDGDVRLISPENTEAFKDNSSGMILWKERAASTSDIDNWSLSLRDLKHIDLYNDIRDFFSEKNTLEKTKYRDMYILENFEEVEDNVIIEIDIYRRLEEDVKRFLGHLFVSHGFMISSMEIDWRSQDEDRTEATITGAKI